jgi:hypothetical protein
MQRNKNGVFYVLCATTTAYGKHAFLHNPFRAVILKTTGAAVAGYSPDSNDVSTEAGESSLLRFVTMKRLLKTLQEE